MLELFATIKALSEPVIMSILFVVGNVATLKWIRGCKRENYSSASENAQWLANQFIAHMCLVISFSIYVGLILFIWFESPCNEYIKYAIIVFELVLHYIVYNFEF